MQGGKTTDEPHLGLLLGLTGAFEHSHERRASFVVKVLDRGLCEPYWDVVETCTAVSDAARESDREMVEIAGQPSYEPVVSTGSSGEERNRVEAEAVGAYIVSFSQDV